MTLKGGVKEISKRYIHAYYTGNIPNELHLRNIERGKFSGDL